MAAQIKSLQIGRGLAALSVAAFHLSIGMGDPRYGGRETFRAFTCRGNLGVDFFFVLSGFIILHAHQRDFGHPERLVNYARRRFARVFPIYWIYSGVLCTLVLLGVGAHASLPSTPTGWVQNFTLIRLNSEPFAISAAWTLVHECAFYAVFSVLIWDPKVGIAIFAVWMLACLACLQYPTPSERTPLTSYFAGWNLNFTMGMCARWVFPRLTRSRAWAALWLGIGVVGLTLALEPGNLGFWLSLYGLGFALIIAGCAALDLGRNSKFLLLIGNASYSIYLTHVAVEGLLLKLTVLLNLAAVGGSGSVFCFTLIGAVTCGITAYLVIEKPMLKWLSAPRRLPGQKTVKDGILAVPPTQRCGRVNSERDC